MYWILQNERYSRLLFTLVLATALFGIGLGLFALKDIALSGASPHDVHMEMTFSVSEQEVPVGEPFTRNVHYICASFNYGCEGVEISSQLPPELSWESADIELIGNDHVISTTFDAETGWATFIMTDIVPATSQGDVQIKAQFPVTAQTGDLASAEARIDLLNGPQLNSDVISVLAYVPADLTTLPFDDGSFSLIAIADAYVDSEQPDANFNGQLLAFEVGSTPDGGGSHCPTVNKMFYLQFDLSNVSFSIDKARLNLPSFNEFDDGDDDVEPPLPINLIGMSDNWAEGAVNWNNQPELEVILADVLDFSMEGVGFASSTVSADSQTTIAHWLASQQAMNGGDDLATVGFTVPTMFGCGPDEVPSTQIMFEDRESGQSRNAMYGMMAMPTLDLAPNGAELSALGEIAPTAVTVSSIGTPSAQVQQLATAFALLTFALGSMIILYRSEKQCGEQ